MMMRISSVTMSLLKGQRRREPLPLCAVISRYQVFWSLGMETGLPD